MKFFQSLQLKQAFFVLNLNIALMFFLLTLNIFLHAWTKLTFNAERPKMVRHALKNFKVCLTILRR